MIPTDPSRLGDNVAALYETIRGDHAVTLSDDDVPLAIELAEKGLGFAGDIAPGKLFWPLQLHPHATVVRGRHDWAGALYAEVSACDPDGCRCGQVMWFHCGQRLASLHGAFLQMSDHGAAQLVVEGRQYCTEPGMFPRLAEITLGDLSVDQVSGQFTRVHGLLEQARWWTDQELARDASACASKTCVQGEQGVHLRIPPQAPARPELRPLLGKRVAITAVSIALVDDRGRRPLERGLAGTLPAGWRGPELD